MPRFVALLVPLILLVVALAWWLAPSEREVEPRPARAVAAGGETGALPDVPAAPPPPDEPAGLASTPVPLDGVGAEPVVAEPTLPPLALRVRHASGELARAALVVLARDDVALARQETDEQGQATLDPIDGPVDVWVGGATWEPFRQPLPAGSGTHDIDLPAGDVLGGRVLVDGRVPDRPVVLSLTPAPAVPWKLRQLLHRDTQGRFRDSDSAHPFVTSAGGRFLVSGLPTAWQGKIWISRERTIGGLWNYSRDVRAPDRDLLLELTLLPRILGRFVDESGVPVPRAPFAFTLVEGQASATESLEADDDGRFELAMRAEEPTFLTIDARAPVGRLSVQASFGPFDGTTDQDLGDIVLRPVLVVTLVVAEPDGTPVQGARACPDAPAIVRTWSPFTDATGRCTFDVPHDVEVLAVLSPRHSTARITVRRPPPEELAVVLEPCACLTITVVSVDGRPPGDDLELRLAAHESLFEESRVFGPSELREELSPLGRQSSSKPVARRRDNGLPEPGQFLLPITAEPRVLSCLEVGVPLIVEVVDRWGFALERGDVVLQSGEQRDLVLRVPATATDVTLSVRDEQGAPVVGAQVHARAWDFYNLLAPPRLVTDAQGTALLSRVFAARLHVRVTAEGYQTLDLRDAPVPRGGVWELVMRR